jgi:hypothetical protein
MEFIRFLYLVLFASFFSIYSAVASSAEEEKGRKREKERRTYRVGASCPGGFS